MSSEDTTSRFLDLVLANSANKVILERLPELGIDDAWLVAGCLFGPVWNHLCDQPPGANINDYDIFYWDPDTSWEAEDRVIKRADTLFVDLGVVHEVRNQARVPLWFEERFGSPFPETSCSADNIESFIVSCTCLGVRPDGAGGYDVRAPKGFDELFAGILRLNPDNPTPDRFAPKCASYTARWPWLTVIEP
ncbi:MAG: nucleotidyltransferase family protein [Alphaproteobacteria bacterium]|nr:nucleotidyltransferase family protein [Rhodospirillaceae bacterium]MBT6509723.1 nucleotidyltransferase family protein [Rhodospirillaceae bacterium]MBT7612553.1 nucleotidyltransferase family protein [Rhodospirillaceae bacterium]MDG2480028.1 nucleotidyltransferase family protein [Alphaproteobacteria bacterium]